MSIRFKFRSSVNFDTVEIGNRGSISVAELRSRILRGKESQQQRGFDLVFSDAVSGLEYKCDSQIPSGSSVIVKRVPGGTLPSPAVPTEAAKHVNLKESHNLDLAEAGLKNDVDDLGADLCPKPDSDSPGSYQGFNKNTYMGNKKDDVVVIPNGFGQHENDRDNLPLVDEQMKFNKLHASNFPTVQSTNLPLELKCSLCNNFFTDAVMIPCCQHSFCEKCISQALIAKGMCPKCSSRKCIVGDLLPNLSLRRAIEHLLESQMFDTGFEDVMQKYAPDGESGIQANDVSCNITVARRVVEAPQSSSATGKGSNQVPTPYGNPGSRAFDPSWKANQLDAVRGIYPHDNDMQRDAEDFAQSTEFQGENQPALPEVKSHADSNANRSGGFWFDSGVGGRSFSGLGSYRKGVRNCYSCGSTDHLMRDCPISHPNPMFQPGSGAFNGGMPGYAPPYWSGPSFPPYTPYANMYNHPSMMPFNPSMVPVSPFAVPPPYISSVGGVLPHPGGNMRMGNIEPSRFEHFELQPCRNKRMKHSNENLKSDRLSDNKDGSSECDQHYSPQQTHHNKSHKDKEQSISHSDDIMGQRAGRESRHGKTMYSHERHEKSHPSFSGKEKRLSRGERSNSAKDNKSRSNERRHHHRDSKEDNERRRHYDSDSSFGHHSTQRGAQRRIDSDVDDSRRKLHHNRPESGFQPLKPVDKRAKYSERDNPRDSSRIHTKRSQERHHGSNEHRIDDHRHQRR